jgi:hypothetical protein
MLMKQLSNLMVLVMVVTLFVMGLPIGVVKSAILKLDSPVSIKFEDVDSKSNYYFGIVTIVRAVDESNILNYLIYWADDSSIIGNPIDSVGERVQVNSLIT